MEKLNDTNSVGTLNIKHKNLNIDVLVPLSSLNTHLATVSRKKKEANMCASVSIYFRAEKTILWNHNDNDHFCR